MTRFFLTFCVFFFLFFCNVRISFGALQSSLLIGKWFEMRYYTQKYIASHGRVAIWKQRAYAYKYGFVFRFYYIGFLIRLMPDATTKIVR